MKTHRTAVAVVPPEDVWEPIQAIRSRRDRHFRRWMPHVNLIYPFRPEEEFTAIVPRLRLRCEELAPFRLRLEGFRHFRHRGEHCTVWLAPEPRERIEVLRVSLNAVVPDCVDQARFPEGFTPHLSVGQVRGRGRLEAFLAELRRGWTPVEFRVEHVRLLRRGPPPDDVFEIAESLPLGRSSA